MDNKNLLWTFINYLKIRDEVKDLIGLPILQEIAKKEEKKLFLMYTFLFPVNRD